MRANECIKKPHALSLSLITYKRIRICAYVTSVYFVTEFNCKEYIKCINISIIKEDMKKIFKILRFQII